MPVTELAARLAHQERRRRWIASMGGEDSPRYRALYAEAYDFAGPDHMFEYLDMAEQIDAQHEAHKRARAAARLRAAAARRALDAEAAMVLQRARDIRLAAGLPADARPPAAMIDLSAEAPAPRAELDVELRAALSLAIRAPGLYREMLPPVGDLVLTMGLKR